DERRRDGILGVWQLVEVVGVTVRRQRSGRGFCAAADNEPVGDASRLWVIRGVVVATGPRCQYTKQIRRPTDRTARGWRLLLCASEVHPDREDARPRPGEDACLGWARAAQ